MLVLLSITALIFFFAAFLGSPSVVLSDPFFGYLFFQLQLVFSYFGFFLLGFLVLVGFFIYQQKSRFSTQVLSHAFLQTCLVFFIGIAAAFIGLFVVGFFQLNIYAFLLNTNPSALGITTDTKTIAKLLAGNHETPPAILASDTTSQATAVAKATQETNSLYTATILPSIPYFFILPIKQPSSGLLFLDNTLIVTRLNNAAFQTLSPMIGYLLVQSYFPNRHIATAPNVSVMTQQQFIAHQQQNAKDKLGKVELDVQKMNDGVSSFSAAVTSDTDALSQNQEKQQITLKQQTAQYDSCLSTGTYQKGVFQPSYSKAYCQKFLDQGNNDITTLTNEQDSLNKKLQQDKQQLNDYQYYVSFFTAQRGIILLSANSLPDELGVFLPPQTIQIVMAEKNTHAIADFFETLCHEYLHFASYTPGKRLDSSFFEEGLTEYFARQVVKDSMQIDTNIGYPVAVKIIEALTKRIPETDLADIYFTKDEAALERALDLAYGDNFYKNNFALFESLQYTADPKQILKLANTLLQHMDQPPLSEKDLFSTQSSL